MPLSRAVRAELSAERRRLLAERKAIDSRMGALEILLSEGQPQPATRAKQKVVVTDREVGLRDALRHVMRDRDHMPPAAVIKELQDLGYAVTGKTPLPTRVYNELKRMMREGLLARDEKGRYALTAS